MSFHILFALLPNFVPDESFYATIPYRLSVGDSLISDEWHLSQFSSFFSYIPVSLFCAVKGSADGLIVFLRFFYIFIHTFVSVVIFRTFREYGYWAVAASLIYYLQIPYKIYAISYNSMFQLFLLLFTISLYLIYKHKNQKLIFVAGIFFASCCVCNPAFLLTVPLYPCFLLSWHKKKNADISLLIASSRERLSCKKAVLLFILGALLVASLFFCFFFGTGGTLLSITDNLSDILNSSEYRIVSDTFISKLSKIGHAFNMLTFHTPFLIPLLFLIILLDKKRKKNSHRAFYLILVITISLLCIFGIRFSKDISRTLFLSLPLSLMSSVCYVLTEKKNKALFVCFWCPCVTATIINLFVSNTLFTSSGFILAVSNVAGIIFSRDLFCEMRSQSKESSGDKAKVKARTACAFRHAIIVILALQIIVNIYVTQFAQPLPDDPTMASEGPLAGMLMNDKQYNDYTSVLNDIDILREKSDKDDPLLIASYRTWLYFYAQKPIATYTAWYDAYIDVRSLKAYYKKHPEKIPKYIYVAYSDDLGALGIRIDNVQSCMNNIKYLFEFEKEELSGGLLLTVTEYRPERG